MKRHIGRYGTCGLVLSLLCGGIGLAGDYATDREAYEALAAASKSTDGHDILRTLNGKWETTYRWWLRPGYDPVEFQGRSVFQWIMERRFMAEESSDKRLDTAHKGLCYIGYDSAAKEYAMVRMDMLGTDLRTSLGKADSSGNSITFHGSYVHPISGATVKTRTILTLDKKDLGFVFFETHGEAEEFKSMEIKYERRKQAGA